MSVHYVCIFFIDRHGTAGHLWAKNGHERPRPVRRRITRKGKLKEENHKRKKRRERLKRERKISENGHSFKLTKQATQFVVILLEP